MKIFKPIGIKPAPQQRYGLSEEDASRLKLLLASDGWHAYMKLLSNYAEFQGQTMLHCSDDAALHCARGLIQGLQAGPLLVDSIIQGEDIRNGRELAREQSREPSADAGIAAARALFGTSLWPSS